MKKEFSDYKKGKTSLRTTLIDPSTKLRKVFFESYENMKIRYSDREKAAKRFKTLRQQLKMSQREWAFVLRVNIRTLQGWETSRFAINPTAETLLEVLQKHPTIKKELLAA